jgi:hypothetical protein
MLTGSEDKSVKSGASSNGTKTVKKKNPAKILQASTLQ